MLMQQLFIVVTELKLNVFKVKKKSQVNVNVTSFVTRNSFGQHRERRGDLSLSQLFVTVEKKCFVLFWF